MIQASKFLSVSYFKCFGTSQLEFEMIEILKQDKIYRLYFIPRLVHLYIGKELW